ncbi:MAG: tetratricopeptide repeat protein [Terriglobia bacterium]
MARFTRKELKKDPFLSVYYDDFVEFAENNYYALIAGVVIIILAVVSVYSWRRYEQRRELAANTLLGEALGAFNAYVGSASPDALGPGAQAFDTPQQKYQAALKQFSEVVEKYAGLKAGEIALYHVGICQAQLGKTNVAVKTLEEAARSSDAEIASLSRLALAGELARGGNLSQAQTIYTQLAAHPTESVPAATAWLALANAERATSPSAARQIYNRLAKDYSSDADLADTVKDQLSTLPK